MRESAFTFRPLTERDLPLLLEWLGRPHLQRWWRAGTLTLDELREKYLPRIAGRDAARPFVAFAGDLPVGYVQSYDATTGDGDYWPDDPQIGTLGIDLFLAEEDRLGQGLGTSMASAFVALVMTDPSVTEIRVDPRPDNLRAIRCYTKVGFREAGPFVTPDGPAIMMILKR